MPVARGDLASLTARYNRRTRRTPTLAGSQACWAESPAEVSLRSVLLRWFTPPSDSTEVSHSAPAFATPAPPMALWGFPHRRLSNGRSTALTFATRCAYSSHTSAFVYPPSLASHSSGKCALGAPLHWSTRSSGAVRKVNALVRFPALHLCPTACVGDQAHGQGARALAVNPRLAPTLPLVAECSESGPAFRSRTGRALCRNRVPTACTRN